MRHVMKRYKVRLMDGSVRYIWAMSVVAARAKAVGRGHDVHSVSLCNIEPIEITDFFDRNKG